MDFNIEVRKKQLESFSQYIKSSKDNVHKILQTLGWNDKTTLQSEEVKIKCPINPNHLLPFKSRNDHIELCQIRSLGYDLKGDFLSDPPPSSSTSSLKLDNKTKIEILNATRYNNSTFKPAWNGHDSDPMTSDRLLSTFSSDERLALYDYCTKNTEPPPKPEEFTLSLSSEKEGEKELSFEQQLIKERDAKRRRVKYKSVHTSRKSQTEIMREMIDNQMDLYNQWLQQKKDAEDVIKHATDQISHLEEYSTNYTTVNNISYDYPREVERPPSRLSKHSTQSGGSRTNKPRDNRNHRSNGRHDSRERRKSRDRRFRRRSRSRSRDRKREKQRGGSSHREERTRPRERR